MRCRDAKETVTVRLGNDLLRPDGDGDDAGADKRDAQRERSSGECGGLHGDLIKLWCGGVLQMLDVELPEPIDRR